MRPMQRQRIDGLRFFLRQTALPASTSTRQPSKHFRNTLSFLQKNFISPFVQSEDNHLIEGSVMSPSRVQLKRAERWLARVKRGKKLKRETYEDYLWALYESCWHVREYLRNDASLLDEIGKSHRDLKLEVNKSRALTACDGIANRSKHWLLEEKAITRSGDAKVIGRIMVRLPEGSTSIGYEVIQNGVPQGSAVKIAEEAINAWKKIFSNWGIP